MEGVTTVLVAVIFVCIMFPHLVRKRPHFYLAMGLIVVAVALQAVGYLLVLQPVHVFMTGTALLFDVVALVLMILSTGGLSLDELTGEMGKAIASFGRKEKEAGEKAEKKPPSGPSSGAQGEG